MPHGFDWFGRFDYFSDWPVTFFGLLPPALPMCSSTRSQKSPRTATRTRTINPTCMSLAHATAHALATRDRPSPAFWSSTPAPLPRAHNPLRWQGRGCGWRTHSAIVRWSFWRGRLHPVRESAFRCKCRRSKVSRRLCGLWNLREAPCRPPPAQLAFREDVP